MGDGVGAACLRHEQPRDAPIDSTGAVVVVHVGAVAAQLRQRLLRELRGVASAVGRADGTAAAAVVLATAAAALLRHGALAGAAVAVEVVAGVLPWQRGSR